MHDILVSVFEARSNEIHGVAFSLARFTISNHFPKMFMDVILVEGIPRIVQTGGQIGSWPDSQANNIRLTLQQLYGNCNRNEP